MNEKFNEEAPLITLYKNYLSSKKLDNSPCTLTNQVLYKTIHPDLIEIVLNRPEKLNTITFEMTISLLKKVQEWLLSDKAPKLILSTGKGKAYSAGSDVTEYYHCIKTSKILNPDLFRLEFLLDFAMTKIKPVHIAIVDGYWMGGGVGLSINAPIRICTENTLFSMPECGIGFFTDVGASYFLTHLFPDQPEIALFLGLTGAKIKGIDNVNCGTATHFIPHDRLDDFKKEIIRNFSEEGKEITYERVIEFVDGFADKKHEKKHFIFINHLQIKKVFKVGLSVNAMFNTLLNMIEKSDDDERNWAKNMLLDLRSKSPLSLIVENELLNRGFSFSSYQEAIESDIQISMQFTDDSDFLEGIRALLIEKDKKPKWRIESVEDINEEKQLEIINFYFKKSSFNTNL